MYSPNIEGFLFIYKFISQQTLYKPDINALMPNEYILLDKPIPTLKPTTCFTKYITFIKIKARFWRLRISNSSLVKLNALKSSIINMSLEAVLFSLVENTLA